MHSSVAGSERQLRAAGIRVTSQRSLILEVLSRPAAHLDANEIFEQARRQDARLSLSTVYRTLSLLKDAGVVNELHLDSETLAAALLHDTLEDTDITLEILRQKDQLKRERPWLA